MDTSPIHHCGSHSFFFRGCQITAVDIPLQLIRESRRGCIFGGRCLVLVVAISPFNTDLNSRYIPTLRPPSRLLLTPVEAVK